MYAWNQYALGKKLANHEISEWDKAKYYVAFAILNALGSLGSYIPFPHYKPQGIESLVGFCTTIAWVAIVFKGIKSVFAINKGIDNSNFIERITCISFPLTIKFAVIFFPIMMTLAFGGRAMVRTWADADIYSRILIRILSVFWIYIFYIFLRKSFRRFSDFVGGGNKEVNSA